MTGGTEGPKEALDRLSQAGVGTLVGMHYSEEHRKKAEELKLNLVIAGHVSSDTLGMNIILDEIEKAGEIEVAVHVRDGTRQAGLGSGLREQRRSPPLDGGLRSSHGSGVVRSGIRAVVGSGLATGGLWLAVGPWRRDA